MQIKPVNRLSSGNQQCMPKVKTLLVTFSALFLLALLEPRLSALNVVAAQPTSTFEQANQLYEQRKYPEAAKAYSQLLEEEQLSPALRFNLGNALFKSGETGKAIVQYRLAAQLLPRDRDVLHNLRFSRGVVQGAAMVPGRWRDWMRFLSLNELALISTAVIWGFFSLLIAGQLWPERRHIFRGSLFTTAAVALLSSAWLALRWFEDIGSRPAVVTTGEAVVRLGPFEESQSSFILRNGAEIHIANAKEDWLQIKDPTGRLGWLRNNSVTQVRTPGLQ